MSVGLVLVTHGATGASMVAEAEFILGESLNEVPCIGFEPSADPQEQMVALHAAITQVDRGDGVLVMTDLIGASPANRVATLLEHFDAVMVTGVNLGMLLCVWANRERTLVALARKAVECGRRGVKVFQR
jgi:PTS system mannose-specific IIA component